MAIVGALTPTNVPAADTGGAMPAAMYHVTVTPAGGAGTYTIAHTLGYAPTAVIIMARNTQGTTPALLASFELADTTATNIAVNFSANGTYDVFYG